MKQSSNRKGFTQVDHVSLDVILPTLSPAAQLVYLRIYRQTVGWKRETDSISHSKFCDATGYSKKDTITEAVRELKDKDLIVIRGKNTQVKEYSINWDTVEKYARQSEKESHPAEN